ncbi:helix-turn-helix domain-containing protein [Actinomadura rupiterrae]|uniref:AraC-like ligand-binding domain-containing protein n=1 Tax=Actinomadura rupiterrae TaxID=559627 RepID=UPI0020A46CF1|nr:helix-turn-helix domain-containing protein [Actinomadura rupiterrae]MCP2337594.1 AraC-like DNA-binding protein [Actinomadura rupiterrae]
MRNSADEAPKGRHGGPAATDSAADRVDWFTETVSRALMPSEFRPLDSDRFHAEGALLDLGSTQVSRFTYSPLRSRRTPRLIRAGDPEQYQMGLVLKGTAWFAQDGSEAALQARDLAVWDTSRPYESGSGLDGRNVEVVVLQIPKAVMPLPSQQLDRLLARRVRADQGLTAVLSDFLLSLAAHGPDTPPSSLAALGNMAVELAAASLSQQLGNERETPAEVRAHALLRRINTFIDQNLGDPELTPRLIAERHHISLRTLYTLFEDEPEGVAASIRRRRLERCRADLAAPELRHRPVQAIAARWGFTSAAAFSRTFRAAYGLTPVEYRRERG